MYIVMCKHKRELMNPLLDSLHFIHRNCFQGTDRPLMAYCQSEGVEQINSLCGSTLCLHECC